LVLVSKKSSREAAADYWTAALDSVRSRLVAGFAIRVARHTIFLVAFMPYFWTGALVADFRMHGDSHRIDRALRSCWLIGWSGLATLIFLGGPFGDALLQLSAHVICLGLMIRASFVSNGSFQRAMVGRWLARIGVASYSIYLVHLQILQIVVPVLVDHFKELPVLLLLVATCVVCGLSTAMAISLPFYWLIERPWVAIALGLSAINLKNLTPAAREMTFIRDGFKSRSEIRNRLF
jgi:peptidoglycan/LPS O-acetylase OafA/YrhL